MVIFPDSLVEGVEVITLAMRSGVVAGVDGGGELVDTVDQNTTVLIQDNDSKGHSYLILIDKEGITQPPFTHQR